MVSLMYTVVILLFGSHAAATDLLSSPPTNVDDSNLLTNPKHKNEHWNMVKLSLDELFPGISCSIHTDNSTKRSPSNLITSSIENALTDIHPSISCTGELNEEVFLSGFDNASHVLEKRRDVACPNQDYPEAQAAVPHPDVVTAQDVQSEAKAQNAAGNAKAKSGYVSCEHANHPDACKACWTGFAAQLASELGACSLTAYAALQKLRPSFRTSGIWVGFMCCVGACTGKFVALSSGCIGR